ncbi:MAG: hypothetical protein HQL88_01120, partial [Magnetococcales bacterium]|nr:hypothetical protein [Magnetococcales bacterium]
MDPSHNFLRPTPMNEATPALPDPASQESWRWCSTPESVEKGTLSLLAVAETVLAVCAYWGIAWYWDTHVHLLASLCVAPLLLLRSDISTQEGLARFRAYM